MTSFSIKIWGIKLTHITWVVLEARLFSQLNSCKNQNKKSYQRFIKKKKRKEKKRKNEKMFFEIGHKIKFYHIYTHTCHKSLMRS